MGAVLAPLDTDQGSGEGWGAGSGKSRAQKGEVVPDILK